jgi:glutathione S-transferase
MSTYKLYYFNRRGRAEVSRLIFAVAEQQYDEIRYERDEWPAHEGETPLGEIPVLEFNGVKLPQSITIARFLAKQFQLAGKDNFEQAKVDAVVDTITDIIAALVPRNRQPDELKKQELFKTFFANELPNYLRSLDALAKLYSDGGPYFVGNSLTWADLLFYATLETSFRRDGSILDNHPWLQHNRAEVEKHPKIAAYLKNRPQTDL